MGFAKSLRGTRQSQKLSQLPLATTFDDHLKPSPRMSYEMNDLLELVVDQKSSDLHLQVGVPPCLRLRGSMTPIDGPELRPEDTEQLMLAITPDNHIQNVKLNGGTDFGFAFGEKARFRVSVLKSKG